MSVITCHNRYIHELDISMLSCRKPIDSFGLFYVTPVKMKHPMFVKQNDSLSHPGIVVDSATCATKEYQDYVSFRENQQIC